jgi:hypothetical protein
MGLVYALVLFPRNVMIKASTLDRDRKIVDLLERKRKTPKEIRLILIRRGISVSLWTIYKAQENVSKFSKKVLIRIWK